MTNKIIMAYFCTVIIHPLYCYQLIRVYISIQCQPVTEKCHPATITIIIGRYRVKVIKIKKIGDKTNIIIVAYFCLFIMHEVYCLPDNKRLYYHIVSARYWKCQPVTHNKYSGIYIVYFITCASEIDYMANIIIVAYVLKISMYQLSCI